MIIKIKAAMSTDGWFYYDNAEEVYFSQHSDIKAFFKESMGSESDFNIVATIADCNNRIAGSFFQHQDTDGAGICTGGTFLSFRRDDKCYEFWLDTEAYLMTDAGKTIERIS